MPKDYIAIDILPPTLEDEIKGAIRILNNAQKQWYEKTLGRSALVSLNVTFAASLLFLLYVIVNQTAFRGKHFSELTDTISAASKHLDYFKQLCIDFGGSANCNEKSQVSFCPTYCREEHTILQSQAEQSQISKENPYLCEMIANNFFVFTFASSFLSLVIATLTLNLIYKLMVDKRNANLSKRLFKDLTLSDEQNLKVNNLCERLNIDPIDINIPDLIKQLKETLLNKERGLTFLSGSLQKNERSPLFRFFSRDMNRDLTAQILRHADILPPTIT